VTSLLPTKFYFPPIPSGFVARPQLLEKLDEALTHRLTLVSAPAGAGKTTLVSAWVQSARKKGAVFGWLSLDEGDNAPGRFLEYLVAGLEEGGLLLDPAALPSRQQDQARIEEFLGDFIRGLVSLKRELILILDDYHVIHNPEVHAALEYSIEFAPPHLHLVLLTRSDPPLELARRRVSGQLVELRMDDLRFTTEEAGAFLVKSAGVHLMPADVTRLNARAEGWIAGLQMAAISLRGREDAAAFVAAFAGSHRFVFDYLLEQVLNRQSPEVREFLLQTSVLERLSAPLCDALVGTRGTARGLLDTLERANLFLMPLDDERSWYRYHHLFADLLRLVLEQTHPGGAAELHRRACHWFEEQGMLPEALQHSLAAGDMQLAAQLVSANMLALVEHAELAPILLRMDAVAREQRASLPWLGVAHAWALAYSGQMERAEEVLTQAEKQREKLPGGERSRLMGHIAAVRGYTAWVEGRQQTAVELTEEAARLLPVEEIAVRALNLTTFGNALVQFGPDPRAVEVLEQAVGLARQAGQSHVFMSAATALVYAFMIQGRLHKAYQICLEAIAVAEAHQQRNRQPLPAAAGAYAEQATILGEWGEAERSLQAARKGLALSDLWGQADTIMVCLFSLANSLLLVNDSPAALQVLGRARKIAQNISPWFVANVDQSEMKVHLSAGNIDQAARLAAEMGDQLPITLAARLLVRQNRLDEALALLERAFPQALAAPSLEAVRLGVLQSLAFFQKRDETRALSALKQTLALAEAEDRVAIFLREGAAMEKLLRLALTRSIAPGFVRRLLQAFEAQGNPSLAPVVEPLIETLSERELEVLRHLDGPLSTPEIAQLLVVSPNTVRTHIKNIYGKLGVHGRSGAVRRAKELGLRGSSTSH
jgi:LuxR family maltose regulon positive regulatory protein